MLAETADKIKEQLINSGLSYLNNGVVGGLVKTAEQAVEVSRDVNDQPVIRILKFPSTCNLTPEQCFENGVQNPLVPDDSKSSIVYSKTTRELALVANPRPSVPKQGIVMQGELTVCAWLNMALMGDIALASCNVSTSVFLDLVGLIDRKQFELMKGVIVQLRVIGQTGNPNALFTEYDYAFYNRAILTYPYDVLGIRVQVQVSVAKSCLTNADFGTPVNCVVV